MGRRQTDPSNITRRQFLKHLRWTPPLLLPAPFRVGVPEALFREPYRHHGFATETPGDFRLSPAYPSRSALDEVLRLVTPGSDAFVNERFAAQLQNILDALSQRLRDKGAAAVELPGLLHVSVASNSLQATRETGVRSGHGIDLRKRDYRQAARAGQEPLIDELRSYFAELGRIETAEFEITSLKRVASAPVGLDTEIRYSLVGVWPDHRREQRTGTWHMGWQQVPSENWVVTQWIFLEERVAKVSSPLFVDVTEHALGPNDSFREQLAHGVDYWRTVLDGASGIDVYGNNGIATGDFDGDGRDDLYVCQPSGLPNRLYRNRGDGTFEDVTEQTGLGVLDATACALFADFENKGLQDLLVVTASGPLLFVNQGSGKFALKRDAFGFAKPPEGTFTHAALADYDGDGRLDVYFCLYSYYLGLDQYHYPSPYFDARNGPPNFLLHNEGNGKFVDRTAEAGLNAENDRFSFACAWGDISGKGGPDLYVANDFGRSNLYRNRGDGTFEAVSEQAAVNVPGAGMSACWCDFGNRGEHDIYVSNMWSASGQRVADDELFHARDAEQTRLLYRRHARGNSLYRNKGSGKFENAGESCGAAMGRWAWSADAWDFDHDGYSDLHIANGYISGIAPQELSSFFWRQVVGNSPASNTPSAAYEQGWNAINELIRSDHTWNGYERNTVYLNNRDGTFSDISGVSGLDFLEDGRSFALADFDGDGRLEVALKNRNAPQVRILRNAMSDIGDSVCFRLRGTKSNRDAIGAAVTVQHGELRQTKYLQAGSGFLSQHSKELFFGLGKAAGKVSVSVRWPSGLTQAFEDIPANHRVSIEEGQARFSAAPFGVGLPRMASQVPHSQLEALPAFVGTWLLDPLPAPDFSLSDLAGRTQALPSLRGNPALLYLWAVASEESVEQLKALGRSRSDFSAKAVRTLCINVDENSRAAKIRELVNNENLSLPVVIATPEIAGVYNILYRYLFDRRRDLPIPCSFLLDESGVIVKVYQGRTEPKQILADAASLPRTFEARIARGLPFSGTLHNGRFARNDFTYGVALFQHGYLDPAAESFKQVIANKPDDPEAYYNLGTLYLRKSDWQEARRYLAQAVKLRHEYPEAWNNLGMIAAQENQLDEAVHNFNLSLSQRPDYVTALLNLGNIYRRQGNAPESAKLLTRAVALEPQNAEANYSLGMLYIRQNDLAGAAELLQRAVALRPDYADAINNLGVLYVRQGKNAEAEKQFAECIRVAPNFDQAYLNLARLYILMQEREKARETLQALLKLQPEHKLAQQALQMLN